MGSPADNLQAIVAPPVFLVPRDLLQAVIQYLAARPAGEVHHLLGGLLALQAVEKDMKE